MIDARDNICLLTVCEETTVRGGAGGVDGWCGVFERVRTPDNALHTVTAAAH